MLDEIADGLWGANDRIKLSAGLMHFPLRMVIVRLRSGGLMLHSPIAIDDELAAAIGTLGSVTDIVAPNALHHLYVSAAKQRFPGARVHVCPALPRKKESLAYDSVLDLAHPCPFAPTLEWDAVAGAPKVEEVVFFHPATRTLLCTDLVFNMHETTGAATPWILRMVGAHRRVAQSRLWRFLTSDRAAAGRSVAGMLSRWPIERIVMSHGDVYEGPDAKQVLEQGVQWMLAAS